MSSTNFATARNYCLEIGVCVAPLIADVEHSSDLLANHADVTIGVGFALASGFNVNIYADGNGVVTVELIDPENEQPAPLQLIELHAVAHPVAAATVAALVRYAAAIEM